MMKSLTYTPSHAHNIVLMHFLHHQTHSLHALMLLYIHFFVLHNLIVITVNNMQYNHFYALSQMKENGKIDFSLGFLFFFSFSISIALAPTCLAIIELWSWLFFMFQVWNFKSQKFNSILCIFWSTFGWSKFGFYIFLADLVTKTCETQNQKSNKFLKRKFISNFIIILFEIFSIFVGL